MPVTRAGRAGALGLLALAWLAGCSFLVDADPSPRRCVLASPSAPDPCPSGQVCSAGTCVPDACRSGAERCDDGIDNDCDGRIDEANDSAFEVCGDFADNDCDGQVDEGYDNDGDGYEWCGDTRTPDGAAKRDCDEYNGAVHPGAPELCDGFDNDCNGDVDEGSGLCPAGEECAGRCVKPSCATPGSSAACARDERCDADTGSCVTRACGSMSCPDGSYCDPASDQCRSVSRGLGEACGADDDCRSGACVDASALLLTSSSGRVCGKACCNDLQCGTSEVCFAPGSGARSCLPKALVTPAAVAVCSTRAVCDGGECSVHLVAGGGNGPAYVGTVCTRQDAALGPVGAICGRGAECSSGMCFTGALFVGAGLCSTPCGTSADCAYFDDRVLAGWAGTAYCRTLRTRVDSGQFGFVPSCVLDASGSGAGTLGTPCSSGNECEDGVCAATPEGNRCAPACCNDADCKKGAQVGQCRPLTFGDHYEMRCIL